MSPSAAGACASWGVYKRENLLPHKSGDEICPSKDGGFNLEIGKQNDNFSQDRFLEAVETWFEPQPDIDMKEAICGAAVFYSLVTPDYPGEARRALLTWWLRARNMPTEQQNAVAAYLIECPADYLAVTERLWRTADDRHLAQERLAPAYMKHRDHPKVTLLLIKATQRWMGFVHVHGQPITRGAHNQNAPKIAEAITERVGAPLAPLGRRPFMMSH